MAWRFQASKYKNAAPKFLKKEENIVDIPLSDVSLSCGNHIKSSCVYTVFNTDLGSGGSLGYLPLTTKGRQNGTVPLINAHTDVVADFDFSPFDDYLLASCSQDNKVKVWLLPEEPSANSISDPVLSLPVFDHRVENVLWNASADGILATTSSKTLSVYNISDGGKEVFSFSDHGDQIQSMSWQGDGSQIATSCRDKKIRIIDPRANCVAQEGSGHQNVKDSRVMWLSGKNYIVSTGFSMSRERQVSVWDTRNFSSCLNALEFGNSTGTIMPFFDADTNMTFLIGKGDNTLNFFEFTEKDPYLTQSGGDRTEQIKGACLVPKRAMYLMEGEVNRLLLLCRKSIIPAPYIVPRKSYRDFHDDIYPDTLDGLPGLTADKWLQGQNATPTTVKLQPNKDLILKDKRGCLFGGSQDSSKPSKTPDAASANVPSASVEQPDDIKTSTKPETVSAPTPAKPKEAAAVIPPALKPTPVKTEDSKPKEVKASPQSAPEEKPTPKVFKPFAGIPQSKLKYISGEVSHPSCSFTNLKNICSSVPGESDMFAANETRCVVPLDGSGGCLQILEFAKATRLPDTGTPFIQNASKVTDFAWDPFDDRRLVVGLDNAKVNVWRFPEGGLSESLDQPEFSLWGHMEKILSVSFHPLASDLIATTSYDNTIRLWDLKQRKEVMCVDDHEDQVFCLAWSQNGKLFATVSKEKKLRVFDPRKSTKAIKEGPGPEGSRGARVVWALADKFLVVSGFSKSSCQEISVYHSNELKILHQVMHMNSPAILIPFYDPDCSLLLLTARGERTVYGFEVTKEEPHLIDCTPLKMESTHQGISYLWKKTCDVKKVEVATAWRLTQNSVEGLKFTVPRVKCEYFQDDLFPNTPVLWEPALTAEEWLAGKDVRPRCISLRPSDMKPLSEAPQEAPKVKKYESYSVDTYKTDEQRKDELLSAMVGKLEISTDPLPQDLTEGVDDDEWDD